MKAKYESRDAGVSQKKLIIGEIAGVCAIFLGIAIIYGALYSGPFFYYDPYYLLDEIGEQPVWSGNFISYVYVEIMKLLFGFIL